MKAGKAITMPADFKYRDVFLQGKPRHDRYDLFSIKHPRMDVQRRAIIFAPFDALKGFGDSVASKKVLYTDQRELSSEEKDELDRRLQILHNLMYNLRMARQNQVIVSVTYYLPCADIRHEDYDVKGRYVTVTGVCWRVDAELEKVITVDKTRIALDTVTSIESPNGCFERLWTEDQCSL